MQPLSHMIAGAPDPVAPFSHAVEADGWVFIIGQVPFTVDEHRLALPEGIEAQTRQVMANFTTVLAGLGLGLAQASRSASTSRTSTPTTRR